jgi:hypothetical protein
VNSTITLIQIDTDQTNRREAMNCVSGHVFKAVLHPDFIFRLMMESLQNSSS